jgi:hypothetical protein
MTLQEKAEYILNEAKDLASRVTSWTEFSNKLFAQDDGLVAKVFPRMKERQSFYGLPQYEQVNKMLLDLIKRFGVLDGVAPGKSGKFLVRVPKTLHTVLEVEAKQEGVSLNQLALTKLSVRLQDSTDLTMKLIVDSFRRVYDGYSTDWVIVHPDYNAKYLATCREAGLTQSDYELNHLLEDIRKSKKAVLPPATKRPKITDYDEFEFASEIAFRYLQRREQVSLDRVLEDPSLRSRFDEIALRLTPEQSIFKLRMAALYLRKTHRLSPENIIKTEFTLASAGPVKNLDVRSLPTSPGLYVFYEKDVRPIFAAQTGGIQHRIGQHLRSSDQLGLPTWLELGCEGELELKYFALPTVEKSERLKWLLSFVNRETPPLNYHKAG